jgi:hypothetical protein
VVSATVGVEAGELVASPPPQAPMTTLNMARDRTRLVRIDGPYCPGEGLGRLRRHASDQTLHAMQRFHRNPIRDSLHLDEFAR